MVRFLEQGADINSYNCHAYQVPNNQGGFWAKQFTCLREMPYNGAECPGCAAGLKMKLRSVFNVIQRNRPVFRKDKDGKAIKHNGEYIVDGYDDQVVLLSVPSTTSEVLRQKDAAYHGLMSRDLVLSDSTNTFQPWAIEPAFIDGGMQPLSEADQALAAKRHNIDEFMKPPSIAEAQGIVNQYGANSGQGGSGQRSGPQGTAAQAGQANGFATGAAVPVGAGGSAFGAAQAPPPPAQPASVAQAVPQATPAPAAPPVPAPATPTAA